MTDVASVHPAASNAAPSRPERARLTRLAGLAALAMSAPLIALPAAAQDPDPAPTACAAPTASPTFVSEYVDETRAGGEPILDVAPDGALLWGSHAGTTHFYAPTAVDPDSAVFPQNYQGQTYYYRYTDEGSWTFASRTPIDGSDVTSIAGVPASGFSDPEFAVDQAGNVFVSEINLANIAVSKSTDNGVSYSLQNVLAFTSSDRQWMAADREDELYMTANGFGGGSFPNGAVGNLGHFIAKSTDGGVTWGSPSRTHPNGVGDIQIDWETGTLFELGENNGTLHLAVFPNIREETSNFTVEIKPIAQFVSMSGVQRLIDPTFDRDEDGNTYVTWYENGGGLRAQGIWYAWSTDDGDTWSEPVRVDNTDTAEIWPWITVGAPGQVAVTWLATDVVVTEGLAAENVPADAPWNVMVATTTTGLGCGDGTIPGFAVTQATDEPVHRGTICQHGTVCQTDGTDRRLGDYFSIIADDDGLIHVAVSDTRRGGSSSLPLHVRQVAGPTLREDLAAPEPTASPDPVADPSPDETPAPDPTPTSPLPATGGGLAGLGLLLLAVAGRLRD